TAVATPLPKSAQAAPSTLDETMQAFNMSQPVPSKVDIVTPTPRVVNVPRSQPIPEPVAASLEVDSGPAELDSRTGLLTIKSYVPARIYIDGAYSGVTPRSVKLIAGEHTVTLVADGFQEWTRRVKLNGKEQAGILASLKKPTLASQQ
ncbi:MAG TPA: PEGA domain-containing protein, partial [Blastocatellia bacterium]|nr:PEGA domain-containing protein [Blastocatellia bacterium]